MHLHPRSSATRLAQRTLPALFCLLAFADPAASMTVDAAGFPDPAGGMQSFSVSGAPAGYRYTVCAQLITGQRACDLVAPGRVDANGNFGATIPAGVRKLVASFSFALTPIVDGKAQDDKTENWRGLGNTDGKAIRIPSELQKLKKLPPLEDPRKGDNAPGASLTDSSAFLFQYSDAAYADDFQLVNTDAAYSYAISASVYSGLDPAFFTQQSFHSAAAIASGTLRLQLTGLMIPLAGQDADPVLSLPAAALPDAGYEVAVIQAAPILDPATGTLGSPVTFAIAAQALAAVPEPSSAVLFALGTVVLLRRSGRLRWAWLKPASAALALLAAPGAQAARIIADATASWSFFDRDRAAVVGVATADGRGCATGLFGRVEDPVAAPRVSIGGCAGGFRPMPPNASADLFPLENIYGRATYAFNAATNTKTLRVVAFAIVGVADAEAKDPVVFDPLPESRRIGATIALGDIDIGSAAGSPSRLHLDFSSSVTGASPLFSLDIVAQSGTLPVVDFELNPLLSSQPGWIKSSLDTQLAGVLAAGAIGGGEFVAASFALPGLSIDVSSGAQVQLYTDQRASVSAVPEPDAAALLAAGGLALAAWHGRQLRRARARSCLAS